MYDDGGRAVAGFRGTCGDCVVRAIAIATEASYAEVYADISRLMQDQRPLRGKTQRLSSPRDGVRRNIYEHYLRSRGWVWVPVMGIGTGCRMHLRLTELPAERIIARTSRHLVAEIKEAVEIRRLVEATLGFSVLYTEPQGLIQRYVDLIRLRPNR